MFDRNQLPQEFPRKFVPAGADLGDWAQIEPLLDQLDSRVLSSVADLEQWVLDRSELAAAIGEESAVRYIRMTCQTDDSGREKAYLFFVEQIEPKLKPRWNRLDLKFASSPFRAQLPQTHFYVLDRSITNRVELFREANVPLETEETLLGQQYQKLAAQQTIQFDGREQTLPAMSKYQEEPDRALRQKAWELVANRRLQDRDEFNRVFDELFLVRQRVAKNAGFANYRDYMFRQCERFDYAPEDCARFHEGVEQHIVPLARELQARRQKTLGVTPLRPWDIAVDPENKPPLRPFQTARELIQGCEKLFDHVDKDLAGQFREMAKLDLLDLDSRKGKAPGGYQSSLNEKRLPFIFMNAVGTDRDVRVLLHEAGHAFHSWAARREPVSELRHAPTEFCEVASMAMELLAGEHLERWYAPEDADRSRREHLESILLFFPWCATIDAFQHQIYTQPTTSAAQRETLWLELHRRFGGVESWEGYDTALRSSWQRQLHLFLGPFYYIEYGIAELGALGIWLQAQKNFRDGVAAYRRALALGGTRPLPDLFAAAGLRFDFGPATMKTISETLKNKLQL